MNALGAVLYGVGALAIFLIDVVSTFWLVSTHGLTWAILAWVTFLPLLIIPFLAGLGVIYLIALVVTLVGHLMREA